MALKIIRNNIADEQADVIVTIPHHAPRVGGGVDWAVHQAAGPELLNARQDLGNLQPMDVRVTPAFRLNAQHVIHALGPVWEGGDANETLMLRHTYREILHEVDRLGCRSVAIPLMGAGHYRFPIDTALEAAVETITAYLADGHDLDVRLIVFDSLSFQHACSRHPELTTAVMTDGQFADYLGRHQPLDEKSAIGADEEVPYYRTLWSRMNMRAHSNPHKPFSKLFSEIRSRKIKETRRRLRGIDPARHDAYVHNNKILAEVSGIPASYIKGLCKTSSKANPSQDKILSLSMALELSREETLQLLASAGHTLNPALPRDRTILSLIGGAQWNVADTNAALRKKELDELDIVSKRNWEAEREKREARKHARVSA